MDELSVLDSTIDPVGTLQTRNTTTEMDSDEFLQLLVLQLRNQDPMSPLDSDKFVTQLAQLQSLEQQRKMTDATTGMMLQQKLAVSGSMIGKNIRATTEEDGEISEVTGQVERIIIEEDKVKLLIKDADTTENHVVLSEDVIEIF